MESVDEFRAAGRSLFSLGLVKGAEGNLSCSDGVTLRITRTGAALDRLGEQDILTGSLVDPPAGSSSDLEVHLRAYRAHGPGAFAHAHPPGTVPDDRVEPGLHGVYAFGPTLPAAVEEAVRIARDGDP